MKTDSVIFDPNFLFISEDKWNDNITRDQFLDRLSVNFEYIDLFSIIILWSDELSERLWTHPQLPPWRLNRDWSNQLIPVIYKKLTDHQKIIKCIHAKECDVFPDIYCDCSIALNLSLKLISKAIEDDLAFYLCLGLSNNVTYYTFSCQDTSKSFSPKCINTPNTWLSFFKIEELFWPSKRTENDVFEKCIKLFFKRKFSGQQMKYTYYFSPAFISDIINTNSRQNIAEMIAKRLSMTTQEAAKDSQLQDEYIEKNKERRFRVKPRPASTRIHYKIMGNTITFKRYFAEGQHDDGL